MLHTKVISLVVLEKKIFKGFFTIYGGGGCLDQVTRTIRKKFCSRIPRSHLSLFGSVVSEEKIFENVDRRWSHWYTYSSGELKTIILALVNNLN